MLTPHASQEHPTASRRNRTTLSRATDPGAPVHAELSWRLGAVAVSARPTASFVARSTNSPFDDVFH